MDSQLSQVPYFVHAMRNWAIDAGFTPHILVDYFEEGVILPFDKINLQGGLVLLNIHNRAVQNFDATDDWVMFDARFLRESHLVELPVASIVSVIVPETDDKIVFRDVTIETHKVESGDQDSQFNDPPKKGTDTKRPIAKNKGRPHLTLVK